MPLHIPVIPACRKSVIRLVSVLILPSLVGRIILSVVSRALSTSSSESLSLSLALKLSTCSLLGDFGGKLTSSFELGGSSLSLGTLSTAFSEFKLTGFRTVSVPYKFRGKVPALSIVLSRLTFRCLTDLPCILAHALISAFSFRLSPVRLALEF